MFKLLILGKVLPESASSAAGTRMMQLIRLMTGYQCAVTFATPAAHSEFADNLTNLGVNVTQVQINDSGFDRFITELSPEAVIFDRFTTEEQFGWRVAQHCPQALRILDTEDLHFLRAARQLAVKENRETSVSDFFSDQAKREIASIYRCDLSLIISESEVAFLTEKFNVPPHLIYYLPLFYAAGEILAPSPSFSERHHFLSIGNFLHEPNMDAVLHLKKNIWPAIHHQLPHAKLHVYGAYANIRVQELNDPSSGFLIKGRCSNALETISRARVLLAPLRFGAGLKGKLLDAMRSGTPSVTTETGAEGIAATTTWPGKVEENTSDFANAALQLYSDEQLWNRCSKLGFEVISERFSENMHAEKFIAALKDLKESLSSHRSRNFTGAMLMHHYSQSTKYMSLWIETKNRNIAESRH